MQENITERFSDTLFRRYTSRLFFVWCVCVLIFLLQLAFLSEAKMEYAMHGTDIIMLSCFFVGFNFLQKCVDSWKADAVIKLIEAMRD